MNPRLKMDLKTEQRRFSVTLTKKDGSPPVYINGESSVVCSTMAAAWLSADPDNRAEMREDHYRFFDLALEGR